MADRLFNQYLLLPQKKKITKVMIKKEVIAKISYYLYEGKPYQELQL
jgi:hypothetical protein